MKPARRCASAAILLASVSVSVVVPAGAPLAQTATLQPIEIPEILVTPNIWSMARDRVGSAVTVVSREEIARMSPASVTQMLRAVPGVTVIESGGPGGSTDVRLRGADTGQTLVLIDGVRANDPSSARGDFDFALFSPNDIERIEVLRGPQSALYGSDAMGGVVNIVTRKAGAGMTASARIEGGSYGTHREQLSAGMSAGDFAMRFSGSYFSTEGFSRRGDRDADEADGSEKWAGTFNATYAPFDGPRVEVGVNGHHQRSDYDGTSATTGPGADNMAERSLVSGFARATLGRGRIDHVLTGFFSDSSRRNNEPASSIPTSKFDATSGGAEYQARIDLDRAGELTLGLRGEHEVASNVAETASDFPGYDSERSFYALYGLHQMTLGDTLHLTFGGRYDGEIDGEGFLTGRGTAAYRIPESGTTLRASLGTGAKRPTAYQIGTNLFAEAKHPGEAVDTALSPERSIGLDAGIDQDFLGGALRISATGFYNRFSDLIVFEGFTCGGCSFSDGAYANVARAETAGLELAVSADILPGLLKAGASYTFLHSRNLDTGRPLPRRPEHSASFDLTLTGSERFEMIFSGVVVGERLNRASDSVPMQGYGRLDVAATYRIAEGTEFFGRIENLTDVRYEDPAGLNAPGLSAYIGLAWTR